MSCFSRQMKLIPTSREWKGFTSTLQTKLQKLKQSKAIKNTRKQFNTLSSFLNRLCRPPHHLRHKKPSAPLEQASYDQRHLHQSSTPVYVDELFTEPGETTSKGTGSSTALQLPPWGVDERPEKFIAQFFEEMRLHRSFPPFTEPFSMPAKLKGSTKSKSTGGNVEPSETTSKGTGSSTVLQLPLWGVDERAEKFIAKFHEEMRLQRERSLGEYQEMLARGAM